MIPILYNGKESLYISLTPHFFSKHICPWYGMESDIYLAYCSTHDKTLKGLDPFKPVPDSRQPGSQDDYTESEQSGGEDSIPKDVNLGDAPCDMVENDKQSFTWQAVEGLRFADNDDGGLRREKQAVLCDAGGARQDGQDGDIGANGEMSVDHDIHGKFKVSLTARIEGTPFENDVMSEDAVNLDLEENTGEGYRREGKRCGSVLMWKLDVIGVTKPG